jgi:MFS family permease
VTGDTTASEPHAAEGEEEGPWLTRGVGGVSAASFFSDSGHEITTSVLPTFVTVTLHSSAGVLGLIEGISDALTGLMKLIGGPLANDAKTRGRLASGGYIGTAVATGAIGLAATVWQAGVLRALAWTSRGLRTPARDSLLASLARPGTYGRAFGLERAGDNLGAVAGPLLAAVLVSAIGIRHALYLAAVPGIFAALSITIAAREAAIAHKQPTVARRRLDLSGLRGHGLFRPLVPIVFFELGNIATTLLILRSTQLLTHGGRSATAAASLAILIYAAHNALAALVAIAGGHWIDRSGPGVVFGTGAALYVLAYAGFAIGPHSWPLLLGAFTLAGSGIGFAETAESALVADLLPDHLRGSGYGLVGGIELAGDFLSTAIVGLLYAAVSPLAGFAYAAAWMLLSGIASLRLTPRAAA